MNSKRVAVLILVFLVFTGQAYAYDEKAAEHHPEYLACDDDGDCDAVVVGCYHWQAVNKNSVGQLRTAYGGDYACTASMAPGQKPSLRCARRFWLSQGVCKAYYNGSIWHQFRDSRDENNRVIVPSIGQAFYACAKRHGVEPEKIAFSKYNNLFNDYVGEIDKVILKHPGVFERRYG